jgi:Trypsin
MHSIDNARPQSARTPPVRAAICIFAAASIAPAMAMVGGAPPAGEDIARSVVMVVGSGGTACTATVIARDLLLTVAHCVLPGADYKLVETQAGRDDVLKDDVLKDIVAVARHPQFDLKKLFGHLANADVALLKLAAPLPAKFSPVALGGEAPPVAGGETLVVAGYGVSVRGESHTIGTLRAATLVTAGEPEALQIRLVDPRTRGKRAGLGACTSDSGAPVLRESGGNLTVVGMVSWSTGPNMRGGCGGMTGATALAPYRTWILETARGLGSPLAPASSPRPAQ